METIGHVGTTCAGVPPSRTRASPGAGPLQVSELAIGGEASVCDMWMALPSVISVGAPSVTCRPALPARAPERSRRVLFFARRRRGEDRPVISCPQRYQQKRSFSIAPTPSNRTRSGRPSPIDARTAERHRLRHFVADSARYQQPAYRLHDVVKKPAATVQGEHNRDGARTPLQTAASRPQRADSAVPSRS